MQKNENTKRFQYKNGNHDTNTTHYSTRTPQINKLKELNQPGMDTSDAGSFYSCLTTPGKSVGVSSTDKDAWYYNMHHTKRGKAIIFNHEHFQIENKNLESRVGTEVDCRNLEVSLNNLGFSVTPYENLTLDELNDTIDYWVEEDHTKHDCFLMAVLSHGEQGIIYAKDRGYKPEEILWGRFTGDKCVTLAGKPKLFFIQACQGDRLDSGVQLRTQVDGPSSFKIPIYADMLIAYSTVPNFVAWRNLKGSWFIEALCDALNKYGFVHDLLTILTIVNHKVAIEFESNSNDPKMNKKKQIPCITSMLTRFVKFEKEN
ncbi:caspase-1-like [Metopolophium dirhodum]|uniref:caspase-1-like n=1 Tax=Metopolophium dirhodum TaxID=44670 RepID=UPI0029903B2E|nr:caspase-1-like [Metopolophium dirhodum]XP_060876416.1 caspase-1-like [Metopolophium dirhodum]